MRSSRLPALSQGREPGRACVSLAVHLTAPKALEYFRRGNAGLTANMEERRVRFIGMGLLAVLLAGCGSTQYVHAFKTQEQLTNDYNKCDRAVTNFSATAYIPQNVYQQTQMIDTCLRKEYGWVKKVD